MAGLGSGHTDTRCGAVELALVSWRISEGMADFSPELWKFVAWNGVSMRVPAQWEVGSLGTSYLQMVDDMGPVLELKWKQLKRFFSHEAHLKKLARLSSSTPGLEFEVTDLPDEWQHPLRNFEARSFKWQGQEVSGRGAILYCSNCRKASLLQFYLKGDRGDSMVPLKVLQTFQDHSENDMVIWSLFGLRALTPQRFGLAGYRFQPGHYQLEFQCGQEHITLSRWGPADVLLKNGDLLDWYSKICGEFDRSNAALLRESSYHGNPAIRGQSQRLDTTATRIWAKFARRLPHVWVRIWHLSSHNQILGVMARGRKGLDEGMLEEICTHYEMV